MLFFFFDDPLLYDDTCFTCWSAMINCWLLERTDNFGFDGGEEWKRLRKKGEKSSSWELDPDGKNGWRETSIYTKMVGWSGVNNEHGQLENGGICMERSSSIEERGVHFLRHSKLEYKGWLLKFVHASLRVFWLEKW